MRTRFTVISIGAGIIGLSALISFACCSSPERHEPEPQPQDIVIYGNEFLVALDPEGKEIAYDYPATRGKNVGIFYFLWQGAHGYDNPGYSGGDILPPSPSDTQSPYDISELEKGYSDPQSVPYGPYQAMHYWGKPYFGYYVGNDSWVIRRHAQMLSEAGVDIIFIDVTNGYSYLPVVRTLCGIYRQMDENGDPRPKVSFVCNTNTSAVIRSLMTLYNDPDYNSMWYRMEGKPLILAKPDNYGFGAKEFFTFRQTWFDTQYGMGGDWYSDGHGKWAWGEFSPQRNVKEEMPVMAGSHANWNIGRSYSGNSPETYGGHQPENPAESVSGKGIYFKQQFEHAISCDPDLIFITGWNEWVAQRQKATIDNAFTFLGKTIRLGDTYFVDCYNHEFSRDIEPCENGFKDAYYYYMTDYIRRYKGTSSVQPASQTVNIVVDGLPDDWNTVGTGYKDYRGDTESRNHWGFGYKNIHMTNDTGRNDIIFTQVATDGNYLFFSVRTAGNITPYTDRDWMRLFISVKDKDMPSWEGFQWVVNNNVLSSHKTMLQKSKGGWDWEDSAEIAYAANADFLEIAIPLEALEISDRNNFTIDFKWIDNAVHEGDIMECMKNGDSAPGERFRYRYIFKR